MNRYIAYCRKSTEAEDRQMLSLESQRQELKRYAEKEGLSLVSFEEESRSAKSPGRPVFDAMLARIERGEANGILAWHPNRLARNALDGGRIIHLADTGKIVDLRFPIYTFENTSQGKFMLTITFGQSKYEVDTLSENVLRGNRTKRELGWLPGRAPIGYLNTRSEYGDKIIASDPLRFPVLKQIWHLLLTGGCSVPQLLDIATNHLGLRTAKRRRQGGHALTVSGIYRVLGNPFYTGHICHNEQWFPGRHEAMISIEQFEHAQELLGRKTRPRPKARVFAYTGLIRCGSCGSSVTAEHKVNRHGSRYVYYHCTRKKRGYACNEKCVEEKALESQIVEFLRTVHIDDEEVKKLLASLDEERTKNRRDGSDPAAALERALAACNRSLDNLTKLRYRDLIQDEEFLRQQAELSREKARLQQSLSGLKDEKWVEPSRNLFLFSNRAVFWLEHGSVVEKRLVLATVGSNLVLTAKKLSISAKEPFHILTDRRKVSDWSTIVNDVRTFFENHKEIAGNIPLLPAIPEAA